MTQSGWFIKISDFSIWAILFRKSRKISHFWNAVVKLVFRNLSEKRVDFFAQVGLLIESNLHMTSKELP